MTRPMPSSTRPSSRVAHPHPGLAGQRDHLVAASDCPACRAAASAWSRSSRKPTTWASIVAAGLRLNAAHRADRRRQAGPDHGQPGHVADPPDHGRRGHTPRRVRSRRQRRWWSWTVDVRRLFRAQLEAQRRLDEVSSASQEKLAGGTFVPIIVNVMNFAKGAPGAAEAYSAWMMRARCSTNSGMRCTGCCPTSPIPSIAGTKVATDFVELPSQLYEHWVRAPGNPQPLRRTLPNRSADARCADAAVGDCQPKLQSGLSPRSNTSLRRWSISDMHLLPTADKNPSTSRASSRKRSPRSACRQRSRCGTAPPISSTYSRVAATPLPTAICGRRCSTPMPSPRLRRPATSSTRAPRRTCGIMSMPPAARAIRSSSTPPSAAGCQLPDGLLRRRGLSEEVASDCHVSLTRPLASPAPAGDPVSEECALTFDRASLGNL